MKAATDLKLCELGCPPNASNLNAANAASYPDVLHDDDPRLED